jgi:hypothetical protein
MQKNTQSLFGSQSSSSSNSYVFAESCHNLVKLFDAICWFTTCGGKKVKHPLVFKLTQQHTNNWRLGSYLFGALFSLLLMSPHLGIYQFTIIFQMTKNTMCRNPTLRQV